MKFVLSLCVALFTAFGAGSVSASQNPTELVVRFKQPETAFVKNTFATVVNANQGVVKMQFDSPEEAQAARAKLLLSKDVANVAPNFLYQLALHINLQSANDAPEENRFLALPYFGGDFLTSMEIAASDLPDVALPPTHVVAGADPLVSQDWAMQNIRMPSVEAVNSLQTGKPLIAAVIDTGVDYNHEDLSGAMWRNPANPQQVGYDFVHKVEKPYDVRHFDIDGCMKDAACRAGDESQFLTNPGHGTHCAGHVGAVANNSVGIRGVGGNVQVMALKFFYDYTDGANAGNGDDASAIQAIDYAIAHGVKVISASWGGRMNPSDAETSELKNALIRAQQAGVLFVVAAGNDGINQDTDLSPDYPAAYNYDNMIVVAATDNRDQIADFSNFGATRVQIGAPGVKIFSTTVGSTYQDQLGKFKDSQGKDHEINWDGTSMATPIVAGAAALLWSKFPDETYLQIRQRILNSARPVDGLKGKVVTGGVLDVSAALGL
jgi:thermitase